MKAEDYFHSQVQVELAEASERGDTNQMQLLIARGADVNFQGRDGMRPLFWALAKRNINGFKFLLNHGADPNAVTEEQPPRESVLKLAACMDESEYLEELLKHGANPNATVGNVHQTAICFASFLNKTNNILILLKNGADIDWRTTGGSTPMQEAIEGRSFGMALFLYHSGANPLIKDKWGYNPIDTLKKFGDNGVVSSADEKAYKQLLQELRKRGLLDKSAEK
jgi:ankyrin repeat protein